MISRYQRGKKQVTHYSPFWQTKLTKERVQEIQSFLETLTDEQVALLNDVVEDARDDAEWEVHYQYNQ